MSAEAIATARHATEIFRLAKDKYFGIYQLEGLAEIEAQASAPEEAIKILSELLQIPAGQSLAVERLKHDPLWDPLRSLLPELRYWVVNQGVALTLIDNTHALASKVRASMEAPDGNAP